MKKKSLVTGALILTTASLITRFIGFFYRIYMVKTIGSEGMGLYQLVMPIYMLSWSITSSGLTTTVSKLTAQESVKKQYGNMGIVLKQSLFLCLFISLILSFIVYFFSDFIALNFLKDDRTILPLKLLAFSFPCMALGSSIRGYFIGVQDSTVPALAQVMEQVARVATVYVLASFLVPLGLTYACAVAIIGIVIGEIISFLFVFSAYIRFKKKNNLNKKPTLSPIKSLNTILSMAVPLSLSRIIGSLLSTVENILIPQRLILFGLTSGGAISAFGQLTGMAMPLIHLPTALLASVSTALVPAISEATAVNNSKRIKDTADKTLLFTSIIGMGMASIFALFPDEICMAVYNQDNLGDMVFKLSAVSPFLYMQITLSGILTGLGEHVFIFKNNIVSSIVSIFCIYFLMPYFGIDAFIFGWFVSLITTVIYSLNKVVETTKIKTNFKKWLILPLMSILASGLITKYIARKVISTRLTSILLIALMFLLYILFLILVGCISKDDILDFIKKRKIVRK